MSKPTKKPTAIPTYLQIGEIHLRTPLEEIEAVVGWLGQINEKLFDPELQSSAAQAHDALVRMLRELGGIVDPRHAETQEMELGLLGEEDETVQ
jgi:hypothetical protein